jgi:hypothetical protein
LMAATSNCNGFAYCGCCAIEMLAERAPAIATVAAKLARASRLVIRSPNIMHSWVFIRHES